MSEQRQVLSKDLCRRLKDLRMNRGWSQGQVAKKIGADPQRVSKYERGITFPTADVLIKIASTFDVTLDYLLRGVKDISPEDIENQELLRRIEKISKLPKEEQEAVILVLDAFIKKHQFEKAAYQLISKK